MPIYEYICPKCQGRFGVLKRMEDRHKNKCPECNTECNLVMSLFDFKLDNPFTKDGPGFTSEMAHPDKLRELQAENRRK